MPSATEDLTPISAAQPSPSPLPVDDRPPALASATRFTKENAVRVILVSATVLVPLFWHRRIEAGDLASHTYNAWLAELIAKGQAPGLSIARQWNNVLCDWAMSNLGSLIGLAVAEKVVVACAVLIFFWGAFAFSAAAARRAPWFVIPCLAVFTYGWTFEMGFLNYYVSLGFAFWGLALIWRGQGWERAWVIPLSALSWMAHPLGTALLIGAGAYLALVRILPRRFHFYAISAATLLLLSIPSYLAARYAVRWSNTPAWYFNGTDQLYLYGSRYQAVAFCLLGLVITFFVADFVGRRDTAEWASRLGIPLQFYGLSLLAVWSLPGGIGLPQYPAPLNLLSERFTTICGVFLCCLLGVMRPKKWHLIGLSVVAAVFFVFLYQDTGTVDRMESAVEQLLSGLPAGQRVISTIGTFPNSRVFIMHIVDRAAIGHVFSYGNYEASTRQFRVRAQPGNQIVIADFAASDAIQVGQYIVRPQDPPLAQIYQCDLGGTRLCLRYLAAGERNGRASEAAIR